MIARQKVGKRDLDFLVVREPDRKLNIVLRQNSFQNGGVLYLEVERSEVSVKGTVSVGATNRLRSVKSKNNTVVRCETLLTRVINTFKIDNKPKGL